MWCPVDTTLDVNYKTSVLSLIPSSDYIKDRHGGLGRDSWLLHVNAYP